MNSLITKDYGWKKTTTHAHGYLLPDIADMVRKSNIDKDARILDAGCGGGFILHELYKAGYRNVWGFDLSRSGINLAKETYAEIKDRFEIHDAYSSALPKSFPQGTYDLVLSVEVIEHLYNPKEYLKNIYSWLKRGGFLLITTPYHSFPKNIGIILSGKFDQHFNPRWEGGHIKFFSKNTFVQSLRECDFEQIEFKGSGRIPFFWKSMFILAQKK